MRRFHDPRDRRAPRWLLAVLAVVAILVPSGTALAGVGSTMRPMSPSELDVQREQFHRELMRKEMRIAELELIVLQTKARYERSMSWQLTRPLRLADRLRRRVQAPKPS